MSRRSVEADDVLWSAAEAKARTEGTTITAVLTRALMDYTGACEVAGVTIVPDPRMPHGIVAITSPGSKPAFMRLADPLVAKAGQPWSRPDASPLEDIRQVEREDRERTSRPFD